MYVYVLLILCLVTFLGMLSDTSKMDISSKPIQTRIKKKYPLTLCKYYSCMWGGDIYQGADEKKKKISRNASF